MTKDYGGHRFTDPQFIVFGNRIGALFISLACVRLMQVEGDSSKETYTAALSCYASPALGNIVASWCQYEALFFVTFPVQVDYILGSCSVYCF